MAVGVPLVVTLGDVLTEGTPVETPSSGGGLCWVVAGPKEVLIPSCSCEGVVGCCRDSTGLLVMLAMREVSEVATSDVCVLSTGSSR